MRMRRKKITSPHDLIFKLSMGDRRIAKDFFKHNLPDYIKQAIKLNTLRLHKETFIDAELTAGIIDILYSFEARHSTARVYILVEAQSTPRLFMPLRLLDYSCRITLADLEQSKSNVAPVVFAMVFYNGKVSYPYTTDIFKLYGENEALMRKILLQPFFLHDLSQIPDEKIKQQTWAGLLQWFMKYIRMPDFLPVLEGARSFFRKLRGKKAENYQKGMIKYAVAAGQIVDKKAFDEKLNDILTPQLKEHIMTYAEIVRNEGKKEGLLRGMQKGLQKGIQKGIQKGRQKGIQEGMQQGMQKGMLVGITEGETAILLRQLGRKFKTLSEQYRRKIEKATAEQLLIWGERVLDAQSIEEVFID